MAWTSGDRIIVRGTDWRVIRSTRFSDCEALDLAHEHSAATRTLLLPFDRPRSSTTPRLQVVSRKRWAREVSSLLRVTHPYGGLRFCTPAVRLLPYQLEPALAVLRHGAARVLIADDVGLGKTVEAGLIVREIVMRNRLSRVLIVTPASVRNQWSQELASLFEIGAIEADASWLRRSAREFPPDVSPWSLPGVYLASMDFVKRPESLHPLEELRWDLLVVDEAHAATPGSDRRAAIHALAVRARRLVLLTATPHSGDDEQFRALCALGAERESAPLVFFGRTRADTPLRGRTARSCLLAVRQSDAETRTHRLLEDYTARIWNESRRRGDSKGELVATVLRKRALSSPVALGLSIRRRLELLQQMPPVSAQLLLPLEEDDQIDEDRAPDSFLGCAGLNDYDGERRLLLAIAELSETAAHHDSKLRALLRLLRRIREPAIVFTEYRDTVEHLSRAVTAVGHRVCVIHGGLTSRERTAVLAAFRSGGLVLIATDAASEGLNLHNHCRVVIHFELPWTPSRLRQRRGRVDRIGQTRRVHEVALVADDTCEQLVILPLLQRALRARSFAASPLVELFPDSKVAAHVLAGTGPPTPSPVSCAAAQLRRLELHQEAQEEAERLALLRRLLPVRTPPRTARIRRATIPIARPKREWAGFGADLTLVLTISLRDSSGTVFDEQILAVSIRLEATGWPRRNATLHRRVARLVTSLRPGVDRLVHRLIEARAARLTAVRAAAGRTARVRDAQMRQQLQSTARVLVQSGLFDRRAMRTIAARDRSREIALDDLSAHADSPHDDDGPIAATCEVRAVLVGGEA